MVVSVDPIDVFGNLGVDSRITGQSATTSPRHNTNLDIKTLGTEHGSARVTLARVNSSSSGADHGVGDLSGVVSGVANFVSNVGHLDFTKYIGNGATRAGSSPTGNQEIGTRGFLLARNGERNGCSATSGKVNSAAQLNEGDVVVEGVGVVVLVHFVAGHGEVLLFSAVRIQAVLANGDAEHANISSRDTVSCIEDGITVQDGTTAGLGVGSSGTSLQGDLAGDGVGWVDFCTADDLVVAVDGLLTTEDEVQWKTGPAWSSVIHGAGGGDEGGKDEESHFS